MNQECSIVRDLLPLYAERLTSPETAAFVEKHLRICADCRAALQETQAPPALQPALRASDEKDAPQQQQGDHAGHPQRHRDQRRAVVEGDRHAGRAGEQIDRPQARDAAKG